MATLLAYTAYARRPSPARYALVFILLGLGLLAKPMLVTLPFVLLLLDYWPLGRWKSRAELPRLIREKALLVAAGMQQTCDLAPGPGRQPQE